MAQKPETVFRQKVDILLSKIPNSWWESIQQKTIRGTPDKIGCINGKFVALELKASYLSEPSHLQEYKLKEISSSGGVGFVLYPENLADVMKRLMEMGTDSL